MEDQTLTITNVLADPTRYLIYQYLSSMHRGVSVQETADRFAIHPNVARFHLNKLEDIQLIESTVEKSSRGGRPRKIYHIADKHVHIDFPPRNYQALSDIAISTLLSMGKEGVIALQQMGRKYGIELGQNLIEQEHLIVKDMQLAEVIPYIHKIAVNQGLRPEIERIDEYALRFRVFNCTFKESAENQRAVCNMHNSLLSGMFEAFLGRIDLIEESSMLDHGCNSCSYTMVRLPS